MHGCDLNEEMTLNRVLFPDDFTSPPDGSMYLRGSRKICQMGSNFDNVFIFYFLVDEGREDPSTTISEPSSTRQRNAIKWRFAGVPMMAHH